MLVRKRMKRSAAERERVRKNLGKLKIETLEERRKERILQYQERQVNKNN